jgi:hypothetical protein
MDGETQAGKARMMDASLNEIVDRRKNAPKQPLQHKSLRHNVLGAFKFPLSEYYSDKGNFNAPLLRVP